jgi:RNA polymerase sigma factor (sigma-70 family)
MTDDAEPPEDTDAPPVPHRGDDDARLVVAARSGDPDAFGRIYDAWFDRVHDLAYRIVRDAEAAADVAQDAFLSAWRNLERLEEPRAFGGWLLRIARNGALDRKRKEQRARPVDEERLAVIERQQTRPEDRLAAIDDPARVAEDHEVVTLLWDAADALGERDREVLDLTLRHGLAPNEIAEVIGLNRNATNQLVHRVRQHLGTAVGARVLWRDGEPACAELRADLTAAGVDAFDSGAVRVAERHVATCAECDERRRTRLSPASMFAAVPIISFPALKAKTAFALNADGVPMQGSSAFTVEPRLVARRHRGRTRRVALGAAAAAAVVVAIVAVGATRLDDSSQIEVTDAAFDEPAATGLSGSSSTTALAPLPTSPVAPPPSVGAAVPVLPRPRSAAPQPASPPNQPNPATAPPPTPAPTTTTSPPRPTISFTITPASVAWTPSGYPLPTLEWSVGGAPGASVTGPRVSSSALQGRVAVCPAAVNAGGLCTAPRGAYTYVLQVKDGGGQVIEQRTQTLTVT